MINISPQIWLSYIQEAKDLLKRDPVMREMCNKYKFDIEDIDLIPIKFDDIDVSARTDKGIITMNWQLLEKDNIIDNLNSYLIHEINHFVRQSITPTQSADDGSYLDNKDEQEAFSYQIDFIDHNFGRQEAEDYVDQVLDHHNIKGKEREEKKDILMEKVQSYVDLFLIKLADKTSELKLKYPEFADDIEFLSENDPSPSKKYLPYAVKQLTSHQALRNEISDVINLFHKLQGKLDNKDINSWNFTQLRDKLFELRNSKTRRQEISDIKASGGETVYEDDKCKVLLVKNKAAACFYGFGTKWCITMSGEHYYEDYMSNNDVFFFVLRKDLSKESEYYKIAIVYHRDQNNIIKSRSVFDAHDNNIGYFSFSGDFGPLLDERKILSLTEQIAEQQPTNTLFKFKNKDISLEEIPQEERTPGTLVLAISEQIKLPEEDIVRLFNEAFNKGDDYVIAILAKYKYLPSNLSDQILTYSSTNKDKEEAKWLNEHIANQLLGNKNTSGETIEKIWHNLKNGNIEKRINQIIENPNTNTNTLLNIFENKRLYMDDAVEMALLDHPNFDEQVRNKLMVNKPGLIKNYIRYCLSRNKLLSAATVDLIINDLHPKTAIELLYVISNYFDHPQVPYILEQMGNDLNEDVATTAKILMKDLEKRNKQKE